MLVLVLGGARSGKSEAAERIAARLAPRVVYLAPGQAWDEEMKARIRLHQERRDPAWITVEEPIELLRVAREQAGPGTCLLLDGLGTWVSNLLLTEVNEAGITERVTGLLRFLAEPGVDAVIVSDEAGLGVVPASSLGRQFRDSLGRANQLAAAAADRTLLVIAGIPIDLKALEATL